MEEIKVTQIGNVMPGVWGDNSNQGRVYDKNQLAPTLNSMQGGGRQPMIVETQIVAMRGRDPEKPSDRSPGNPNLIQRLEPNSEGICNTITTVQKDNMVLESIKLGNAANSNQRCAVYDVNGLCPTIQAAAGMGGNQMPMCVEVKQATKNGKIPCLLGGGGRSNLPNKQNQERKSDRYGNDMPNIDNGEYP